MASGRLLRSPERQVFSGDNNDDKGWIKQKWTRNLTKVHLKNIFTVTLMNSLHFPTFLIYSFQTQPLTVVSATQNSTEESLDMTDKARIEQKVKNLDCKKRNNISQGFNKCMIVIHLMSYIATLELQQKSGNLKDWPTFIECFNSLIHNNTGLTDVDRAHYLIGSLSGAALNVCSGVSPTGENYRIIYQALHFPNSVPILSVCLKIPIGKTEMPSYSVIITFVKEQSKICIRSPNKKVNNITDHKTENKYEFLYKTVLLSTVKVNISDVFGKQHEARFLFDSCSQANFLTLEFCRRLNLKISKCYKEVQGIGRSVSKIYGYANVVIVSQIDSAKKYALEVLVVEKVSSKLPQIQINTKSISHLLDIPLADDSFYKPNQIDGIIGAELYPHLLGKGRILGPPKTPIALETSLGYIVMGSVPTQVVLPISHNFCNIVDSALETLVKRFWEIEDVHSSPVIDPKDVECETIFQSTFRRDSSGRYVVSLPFQYDPLNLGDSYNMAKRRLFALEKKFIGSPIFRKQYTEIIQDYLVQGHITKVLADNSSLPSY
ncbi:hypothetical protein NQ317_001800 [Molorchus minor]|uniref:Peptidase aspartic putative domain-containing protein n=1 Tax=Molorchus minor TaxID=1323400 RepID=A0ABQ9IR10_9CUCU|nr:hypothetical protein NQ317_001800 [Molorchus minor]